MLCDDSHIRKLNMEWRGKDAPTDVLSFELGGEEEEEGVGEEGAAEVCGWGSMLRGEGGLSIQDKGCI